MSPKRPAAAERMAQPLTRLESRWVGLMAPSSWDPLIQAGLRSAVLRCPRPIKERATGHIWQPAFQFDDDGQRRLPAPSTGFELWECALCGLRDEVPTGKTPRGVRQMLNKLFGRECEIGGIPGGVVVRECGGLGHWRGQQRGERVTEAPRPGLAGEGDLDGTSFVWRHISDVWECSRCGHTTRDPRIGQIGTMGDCSWRGKGRLSHSDRNALDDSLADLCDLMEWNGCRHGGRTKARQGKAQG